MTPAPAFAILIGANHLRSEPMFLLEKAEFDRLPHNRRFAVLYEHAAATEKALEALAATVQVLQDEAKKRAAHWGTGA